MRQRNLLPQICYIALTTERRDLKNRLGTANPEGRISQVKQSVSPGHRQGT